MNCNYTVEKDWITKSGLRAVCVHFHNMHRCGYVGVDKKHCLYGLEYSIPASLLDRWDKIKNEPAGKRSFIDMLIGAMDKTGSVSLFFDVHDGITYSKDSSQSYPVESNNTWWFGFDCAHANDDNISQEYVEAECESFAEQLASIGKQEIDNK
jgi:hypothetical protein